MTVASPAHWWRGLGVLTRSGSSIEALAWAFYDFANTIFSFAIVSFAMSLWTIRFLGEGPGTFWFTAAVSVSVLLNAIVSPVLGAMSAFAVHAIGFTEGQALQVLLVLTVVAVIASVGWGFLADRWGPRRTLFAVLGTWAIGLVIITAFLSPSRSCSLARCWVPGWAEWAWWIGSCCCA